LPSKILGGQLPPLPPLRLPPCIRPYAKIQKTDFCDLFVNAYSLNCPILWRVTNYFICTIHFRSFQFNHEYDPPRQKTLRIVAFALFNIRGLGVTIGFKYDWVYDPWPHSEWPHTGHPKLGSYFIWKCNTLVSQKNLLPNALTLNPLNRNPIVKRKPWKYRNMDPSKVSSFLHNNANSPNTEPAPPPNRTQIKTRTLQVQWHSQFATVHSMKEFFRERLRDLST